jgi:hypothetical protein
MSTPEIMPDVVRRHIELVHRLAEPLKERGRLVVFSCGEDPLRHHHDKRTGDFKAGKPLPVLIEHFVVGDVDRNVAAVLRLAAEAHRNVYMPLAVMRPGLGRHQKGGEADIVAGGALGLALDFDDEAAERWGARLPIWPNYVLATSVGRFQCIFLFTEPVDVVRAKGVAARVKEYALADSCTIDISHPWRVPGLLNWPNAGKHKAGRSLEPQLVTVLIEPDTRTGIEVIDRETPLVSTTPKGFDNRLYRARWALASGAPEAIDAWHKKEAGDPSDWEAYVASRPQGPIEEEIRAGPAALPSDERVDTVFRMLPESIRDKIATPAPSQTRSQVFATIVGFFRRRHPDVPLDVIEAIFERFPDGPASKYRGRLRPEIDRLYAKKTRGEAYQDAARERRGDKPVVQLMVGAMTENLDEAEEALVTRNNNVFRRGDLVVMSAPEELTLSGGRVIKRTGIVPITPLRMREIFTKAIDFQAFNNDKGEFLSIDCPHDFARTYLDRRRGHRLPYLAAVVTTPFLRVNGSLVQTPGYDSESGILFEPNGVGFPKVPENPGRDDALAALKLFNEVYRGFPFVPDAVVESEAAKDELGIVKSASRSVAYSLTLAALVRSVLRTCPLHGFSAPRARSGKTKLCDIASIVACGHPVSPIGPGDTDEELEKRLAGELLGGSLFIVFDNLERPLHGVLICQCLTQSSVKVRILRTNDTPVVPCLAVMAATGNNLVIAGDLAYRGLRCDIDSGLEAPETRHFEEDAVDIAARLRPALVVAGLTILKAYHFNQADAETMEPSPEPIGGFEDWSRWVREPLLWLGQPDPWATVSQIRDADPELAGLTAVIAQWERHLGLGPQNRYTVREIIARAVGARSTERDPRQGSLAVDEGTDGGGRNPGIPDLREVLLVVGGIRGDINSVKLGRWLGKVIGRNVGGRRILRAGVIDGLQYWEVRSAA